MSTEDSIPADVFLDRVLVALRSTDTDVLHELEIAVANVSKPISRVEYFKKCATLVALLDETARNLRLFRRTRKQFYSVK